METVDKERAIRGIVRSAVESYASGFSDRHIREKDDEDGTINMKIHNVFIAALGPEIQYYSALCRSLDSSLGNMLEKMAINIAGLNYTDTSLLRSIIEDKTNLLKPECWCVICKSDAGYEWVVSEWKNVFSSINKRLLLCA